LLRKKSDTRTGEPIEQIAAKKIRILKARGAVVEFEVGCFLGCIGQFLSLRLRLRYCKNEGLNSTVMFLP